MEPELDPDVHAALRRSAPAPDPAWERELERRLIARTRSRGALARRPVVGAAATAAIAAAMVVAGLAGSGPLSVSNDDSVQAEPDCTWVKVTRDEPVRKVVIDATGQPSVVTVTEPVTRTIKRCR